VFLPLLRAEDDPLVMVSSAGGSFAVVTDPEQPVSKMHELAYSSSKAALNLITVRYAQPLPDIMFNSRLPGKCRVWINHARPGRSHRCGRGARGTTRSRTSPQASAASSSSTSLTSPESSAKTS
jgi:NAD(P)-dependent dehydrogenase (short-subunit alcohol dehydrogenase family)